MALSYHKFRELYEKAVRHHFISSFDFDTTTYRCVLRGVSKKKKKIELTQNTALWLIRIYKTHIGTLCSFNMI